MSGYAALYIFMNVIIDQKQQNINALKNGKYPIILDRERHLLFSLNVMQELQEKTGGIAKLEELITDDKNAFRNIKWLLTLLINEGADDSEDQLNERQVGKMIHAENLQYIINVVLKAYGVGTSGNTDSLVESADNDSSGGEDEEKNVKSGQGV